MHGVYATELVTLQDTRWRGPGRRGFSGRRVVTRLPLEDEAMVTSLTMRPVVHRRLAIREGENGPYLGYRSNNPAAPNHGM